MTARDFAMLPDDSVKVTTDSVMTAIREYLKKYSVSHFTTRDIARHMEVDEYPVRTAFSWLNRYHLIETAPCVRSIRYTGTAHEKYSATVYKIKPESTAADFAALMGVFCRG